MAAVKFTNPSDADFDTWLKRENPFLDGSGMYPTYMDMVRGVNWQNSQATKRNALMTPIASAPTATSTPGAGGTRYSTLRLTKNPALQGLFDFNLGNVRANSSNNYADLGRYLGAIGGAAKDNAADLDQENAFINGAFNGDLEARLAAARNAFAITSRESIANAGTQLGGARDRFRTAALGDITQLQSDLAKQRAGFEARVAGEIGNEVSRRAADLTNYGRAAGAATDLAVNQSNRNVKALAMSGLGGSSYTDRLGVGAGIAAHTNLAQRIAEIRAANTERELARRAALTDTLGGLERGEISGAGSARLGLTGQLAGQERSDIGYTLGREASLNDTLYNAERGDIQYVRDQAGRVIGLRRIQRNATAQDALLPIATRQAIQSGDLDAAMRLGSIDQSNTFYGIDDGTGDALSIPRTPRISYARPMPAIDIPSSVSPMDYFSAPIANPAPSAVAPGPNIHANRSAAERAYFQSAGVYPDQDPNFSSALWQWARGQVQSSPAIGSSRFSLRSLPGEVTSYPIDYEGDVNVNARNYFAV